MLGTLQHYRTIENSALVDPEEGMLRFNLNIDEGVMIPTEIFNIICGPTLQLGNKKVDHHPGYADANFNMAQLSFTDDMVTFKKALVVIRRETLNCFVFCLSQVNDPKECREIFPSYSDCWWFDLEAIKEFSHIVTCLLYEKIHQARIDGNPIIPNDVPFGRLSINCRMGAVEYMDRDLHISKESDFEVNSLSRRTRFMEFVKPTHPFEREKEYRLSFTILVGDRIIEPCVKHVQLNSNNLKHLIL